MFTRLKNHLQPMLSKLGLAGRAAQEQAVALWPEVVGEALAGHVQASHMASGILFVIAESSVWATELSFHKVRILTELNRRIGKRLVQDLRYLTPRAMTPGSTTQAAASGDEPAPWLRVLLAEEDRRAIDHAAAEVADDALRSRVRELLAKDRQLQIWKHRQGYPCCRACGAFAETDPCDLCAAALKQDAVTRIRRLLGECPWCTYEDAVVSIPALTQARYAETRTDLLTQYSRRMGQITPPGTPEDRMAILTLAMLKTHLPPTALTTAAMERAVGATLAALAAARDA